MQTLWAAIRESHSQFTSVMRSLTWYQYSSLVSIHQLHGETRRLSAHMGIWNGQLGEQRIYCDKGAHHNSPIILPQLEVVVHWQTGSWMLNVIHVMIVGIEGGKNLMQMLTYPGDGYG